MYAIYSKVTSAVATRNRLTRIRNFRKKNRRQQMRHVGFLQADVYKFPHHRLSSWIPFVFARLLNNIAPLTGGYFVL